MCFKIIILLMLINETVTLKNVTKDISFILSLLEKQVFPGKLNAFLCWPEDEKLELWKSCSEDLIPAMVTHSQSLADDYNQKNEQIFLVDLDCQGTTDLLRQSQDAELFRWPNRWIILGDESKASSLDEFFFDMESKVYVVNRNENGYKIKMPYKITMNDPNFLENDVASWRNGIWLYFNHITVPRHRLNLMGTRFRVSYVFTDPDSMNHVADYRNTHIDPVAKANYMLINSLMMALNVTPTKKYYKSFGHKVDGTGNYNNVMGDLQRNETEMTGITSIMTPERLKIQHFLYTSFDAEQKFVFRAPRLSFVTNIFTVPFDAYVWYASCILTLVILPILYFIIKWEWILLPPTNSAQVLRDDVSEVCVTELGAITQQGTETEPRSMSGRIAMYITFMAFFFLYNAFSANIYAVLQATSETITSPSDLHFSDMAVGAEDSPYSRQFFKEETNPIKKAIADKVTFMSTQEGIQRMQNGYFAFQCEISTVYKILAKIFTAEEICKLREVSVFNLQQAHFGVPLNSRYKKILKYRLLQMREFGIMNCEQTRVFSKRPDCLSQGSFAIVGMTECYAAYLIFGTGIGCTLIFFLMEILWSNLKTRHGS